MAEAVLLGALERMVCVAAVEEWNSYSIIAELLLSSSTGFGVLCGCEENGGTVDNCPLIGYGPFPFHVGPFGLTDRGDVVVAKRRSVPEIGMKTFQWERQV